MSRLPALALFAAAGALPLAAQPEQTGDDASAADAEVATAAEEAKPNTLAELLNMVRDEAERAERRNAERIARFQTRRDERRQLLDQASRELAEEVRRGDALGDRFERNERELQELEERLAVRIGNFGELFGVVRQVAGDAKGLIDASLVSAERPGRGDRASGIAQARALPGLRELRELQLLFLEEMVASSEVSRFQGAVTNPAGAVEEAEMVRVGAFNLVRGEDFLAFNAETGTLQTLPRQPAGRHRALAAALQEAEDGPVPMAVDPTRGQLLGLLMQTPTLAERIQQGGYVGYVIIAMGIVGAVIAIWRLVALQLVRRRVNAQLGRKEANEDNPLGRVFAAFDAHRQLALDALSLRLDEAVMRETPRLERWQGIVKVFAALAPLLGLLGTVVGMIITFQQLTLFGTGDPKLMAGGISQALMTTVLGLIVAIPLLLLHSVVASASRSLVELLEEQSVGLVARRAAEAPAEEAAR